MSFIIGIIVPRQIGPEEYGKFGYITATYAFYFQLLMFSAGTGYVYLLSNRKYNTNEVNTVFFLFIAAVSFIVLAISLISSSMILGMQYIWNDCRKALVFFGVFYGILLNLQQRLIEFSDSTSQTTIAEKAKVLSKLVMVAVVILLSCNKLLNLDLFFALSLVNLVLFTLLFYKSLRIEFASISKSKLFELGMQFYLYMRPLILFILVASIYSYIGRYTLEATSGSLEQGYYNFAYQLSFIPVTFVSSIMSII